MSYFVRKYAKPKWIRTVIDDNPFDIPADVICSDLKTDGNTLSVWEIEDETKLEDAVLAITSDGDRLDTIDIIWIEKSEIEMKGVSYKQTPGKTPIKQLVDTHVDLCQLSYYKIGLVAESISEKVARDVQIKRYTQTDLKKIYKSAISNGVVDKDSLKPGISDKL
jgi:hypothetical protein